MKQHIVDMKTIGIAGAGNGVGTTHFCITLASKLYSLGYKVAILEDNDSGDFDELAENTECPVRAGKFTYKGIDYYTNQAQRDIAGIRMNGYQYLIVDNGNYSKCDKNFYALSYKNFIVASSRYWNFSNILKNVLDTENQEIVRKYTFVFPFSFANKKLQKEITSSLEMTGISSIFYTPVNEDPFEPFEYALFSEMMDIEVVQPKVERRSLFVFGRKAEKKEEAPAIEPPVIEKEEVELKESGKEPVKAEDIDMFAPDEETSISKTGIESDDMDAEPVTGTTEQSSIVEEVYEEDLVLAKTNVGMSFEQMKDAIDEVVEEAASADVAKDRKKKAVKKAEAKPDRIETKRKIESRTERDEDEILAEIEKAEASVEREISSPEKEKVAENEFNPAHKSSWRERAKNPDISKNTQADKAPEIIYKEGDLRDNADFTEICDELRFIGMSRKFDTVTTSPMAERIILALECQLRCVADMLEEEGCIPKKKGSSMQYTLGEKKIVLPMDILVDKAL
jgi:hypothetical protein